MSPRAILWTWVLFFEAVVGLVAFGGPPIVALGMNIGFLNGIFVIFVAVKVDRRRKRQRGHAPPGANGSVW